MQKRKGGGGALCLHGPRLGAKKHARKNLSAPAATVNNKKKTKGTSSPSLPLLPAHGDEAVEELVAQRDGRDLVNLAAAVRDLEAVGNGAAEAPADEDAVLPAVAAHLFELADVGNVIYV